MIDISVLYGGLETPSTPHRYGRKITQIDPPPHQRMAVAKIRRAIAGPSSSGTSPAPAISSASTATPTPAACKYDGELTTAQAKAVLDDLADFKVPAVLFSGGEPLVRPDLFELAAYARSLGPARRRSPPTARSSPPRSRSASRNSSSPTSASRLDSAIPAVHDEFRGVEGAFERTMQGFRHCVEAGQKVGLRLTLTRHTAQNLDQLFDFIEREGIDRACFYHLCPAGRGKDLDGPRPPSSPARPSTPSSPAPPTYLARGKRIEILTVDNHCDGPYLYLRMLRENHPRAQQVLDMLAWNGGGRYSSGVGIANIDFNGNVHADQFSMYRSFGNVKERKFSEIWQDIGNPIMAGLKDRLPLLEGRCGTCRFKAICGGSLRARAEITTGNPWAADPGCYLTDEEITGEPVIPVAQSEPADMRC